MRRGLLLVGALSLLACDDGAASGRETDAINSDGESDGGANSDAASGCESNGDCAGRVCVEGACVDCVGDGECVDLNDGRCLDGRCCAGGSEGCACGAGCADGLACEADRCVAEEACPDGTAGCPCGAECGPDLACQDEVCVACAAGSEGCACGDGCEDGLVCRDELCAACPEGTNGCLCGAGCGDGLECTDGRCSEPSRVTCDDLDCAAQNRLCEEGDADARCGACDLGAGFADDGAGGCRELTACESVADCADGELCLDLGDAGRRCTLAPACVDLRPAASQQGRVWDPNQQDCRQCPSCAVPGSTGALWPTTSADGDCVCETEPGWYHDVSVVAREPRQCDADGDGWVVRPAQQYVDSADPVLRVNARCALGTIEALVLRNERGQARRLEPDALGWPGPLPRYEPALLDSDGEILNAASIPARADGAKPAAATLNPLTKHCVAADADFNGNRLADVAEAAGAELVEEARWMAPFLGLAHFSALHQTTLEGGVLTVAEKPRCADGFPFDYEAASDHWRECERRRPASFRPGVPGADFGAWSCDAEEGACPGLPTEAIAPDGVVRACSAPAGEGFEGMNHSSQFQCVVLVDGVPGGEHERSLADEGFEAHRCEPADEGVVCAPAERANRAAVWALELGSEPEDDYQRGCQAECRQHLALCPDPERRGCRALDFGQLECTLCAREGEVCETGRLGLCATGIYRCDADDQEQCVQDHEPAEVDPLDGVDADCDGFDGRLSDRPIFVARNGDDRSGGDHRNPVESLDRALELARADAGRRVIYLEQGAIRINAAQKRENRAQVTIDVPVTVHGGFERVPGPGVMVWSLAAEGNTEFRPTGTIGFDISADVTFNRIDLNSISPGRTKVGVRVLDGSVTLIDSTIDVPDGRDGADAVVREGRAANGTDGQRGYRGYEVEEGLCAGNYDEAYESAGEPGDCGCGENGSCGGGGGGRGGLPATACNPATGAPPQPGGDGGDGQRAGTAGDGGSAADAACTGDDEPAEEQRGNDGDPGPPGAPGVHGSGAFSTAHGWTLLDGLAGEQGRNGGGGGGGAGGTGAGGPGCRFRGGRGGGGGGGGCGGLGGRGGQSGGGAIGVLAVAGGVTLIRSVVTAGDGGDGGDGVAGQRGGDGGEGGAFDDEGRAHAYSADQGTAGNGASGGDGGNGGVGGNGGAGAGGPSVAVVYSPGAAIDVAGGQLNCGNPGTGGAAVHQQEVPEGVPPVRGNAPDGPGGGCLVEAELEPLQCFTTADCGAGEVCLGVTCVEPRPWAAACQVPGECRSGSCRDGRCACVVNEDCDNEALRCDDGACVVRLSPGDRCEDDDECGFRGTPQMCVAHEFDARCACVRDDHCGPNETCDVETGACESDFPF